MKNENKTRGGQQGSTMIETGIAMVLFILLFFGIVGWGHVIWAYSWTSHISREAARFACVRQSLAASSCAASGTTCCGDGTCPATKSVITSYVKSHMLGLNPSRVTVDASFPSGNLQGQTVTVTVNYQVPKWVPYVPAMTVGSSSTMAISQ